MTTDRPDIKLAEAVDQALAMVPEHGVQAAAAFLADRGAGFALTCRVLAEPARRRAAGNPPPPLLEQWNTAPTH